VSFDVVIVGDGFGCLYAAGRRSGEGAPER
jgi:hypothetical protein